MRFTQFLTHLVKLHHTCMKLFVILFVDIDGTLPCVRLSVGDNVIIHKISGIQRYEEERPRYSGEREKERERDEREEGGE